MDALVNRLLGVLARIEAYIDFPDEDLPPEEQHSVRQELEDLARETDRLLATSHYGEILRDGIKVVNKLGVVPESEWTYDDTPANPTTHLWPAGAKPTLRPPPAVFTDAKNYQAIGYQRVLRALSQFKGVLASGYPFVFGFTVYASFESLAVAQTGKLNLPAPAEACLGGHAVLAVGYDDLSQRFIVRNSWGSAWGQAGYFTMPYAYLLDENLSDDFWTIRLVE